MTYNPAYYEANKERHAEYNRRYRTKYKDKERLRHKKYREANKAQHADYERRRRARKRSVESGTYTTQQILEEYGAICHLCGDDIDLTAERKSGRDGWENGLHIDHLIPLARGGSDRIENVRPAHGLCNLRKNRYKISS